MYGWILCRDMVSQQWQWKLRKNKKENIKHPNWNMGSLVFPLGDLFLGLDSAGSYVSFIMSSQLKILRIHGGNEYCQCDSFFNVESPIRLQNQPSQRRMASKNFQHIHFHNDIMDFTNYLSMHFWLIQLGICDRESRYWDGFSCYVATPTLQRSPWQCQWRTSNLYRNHYKNTKTTTQTFQIYFSFSAKTG